MLLLFEKQVRKAYEKREGGGVLGELQHVGFVVGRQGVRKE